MHHTLCIHTSKHKDITLYTNTYYFAYKLKTTTSYGDLYLWILNCCLLDSNLLFYTLILVLNYISIWPDISELNSV